MTNDETRARHLAEYNDTHDPNGHPLQLSATQDALDTCEHCGRTAPAGWNHALDCPLYEPHPASIVAQGASA